MSQGGPDREIGSSPEPKRSSRRALLRAAGIGAIGLTTAILVGCDSNNPDDNPTKTDTARATKAPRPTNPPPTEEPIELPTETPVELLPIQRDYFLKDINKFQAAATRYLNESISSNFARSLGLPKDLASLTDRQITDLREKLGGATIPSIHITSGIDGTGGDFYIQAAPSYSEEPNEVTITGFVKPPVIPGVEGYFDNQERPKAENLKDIAQATYKLPENVPVTWIDITIPSEVGETPALKGVGTSPQGDIVLVYIDTFGQTQLKVTEADYRPILGR